MTDLIDEGPATPPEAMRDTRVDLAEEFLQGSGVEIGALHLAMRLPAGVQVRYVDRMTVEDLRSHYPELGDLDLAPVDIVDDGELLSSIDAESLNFIVANHFLEHCEDPIATIANHLTKLTPGGVLFYAVPDKRYTFDFRRPRTPLGHHIADHDHGPEISRSQHYLEWASLVHQGTGPPSPEQAQAYAHQLQAENYSIHFHVWTQADLIALMLHCHDTLDSFEIEAIRRRGHENIIVLRTHGARDAVTEAETGIALLGAPETVTPSASIAHRARPSLAAQGRIPLAALRELLDERSAPAHWSRAADGILGRALVMPAGSAVTFPLALDHPVSLRGRVRLLPHDWLDGVGSVRAVARIRDGDSGGDERELWAGVLASAQAGGVPEGVSVDAELPAQTTALTLTIEHHRALVPGLVGVGAWSDPELADDRGAGGPNPVAGDPARAPERAPAPERAGAAPRFSVLTPVHDPPVAMLRRALDSVRAQTLGDWELRLVDDGSTDPEVIALLARYAAGDSRIHLRRREQAGGISDATNAALSDATGDYVALLDHDDTLAPTALARIADRVTADPELDMVYTDEAVEADGRIVARHLKPGWSPESLQAAMYTTHLGIYRRALVDAIGGFRSEFDGCQDYDLVLRLTERTDRVAHIPEILYHWHSHASSTAGGDQAKPWAYLAQPRAIAEHLARTGVDAEVQFGPHPGTHRIVHRVDPSLAVSIVVAPADVAGLTEAARSWVAQSHPRWGVVLAVAPALRTMALEAVREGGVEDASITVVDADPGRDLAGALAAGAAATHAPQLVLMPAPAVGLNQDWLTRLIGYSCQPGIAAAGALVIGADGRIEEAGTALPDGIPLPLLRGLESVAATSTATNLAAVSGLLATSRRTFDQLGGLSAGWGHLALVEYCMRATAAGQRIVGVPDARVRLPGAASALNDVPALWRLRRRWAAALTGDPFFHPGYRSDRGDYAPIVG